MPPTTTSNQSYLSLIQIPKPSLSISTTLAVVEPVALARNHKYKQNQYKQAETINSNASKLIPNGN